MRPPFDLGIAVLLRGSGWPAGWIVAAALALGAVSYGASILLDAYALRLSAQPAKRLVCHGTVRGSDLSPSLSSAIR